MLQAASNPNAINFDRTKMPNVFELCSWNLHKRAQKNTNGKRTITNSVKMMENS